MGFMNILGDIMKGVGVGGAGIATALSGGVASPLLMASMAGLSAGGSTLGALGAGAAAGRVQQAQTNQSQDKINQAAQQSYQQALLEKNAQDIQAAQAAAQTQLQQKQFELTAPAARLANAIRGNVASNMQDVHVNRPAGVPTIQFSGGLRPSDMGPESRQAGQLMASQALHAMQTPDQFSALPTSNAQVLPQFTATALPKPGLLSNLASAAGVVGGGATAAQNAMSAIQKILGQGGNVPNIPTVTGLPSMAGFGTPVGSMLDPSLLGGNG